MSFIQMFSTFLILLVEGDSHWSQIHRVIWIGNALVNYPLFVELYSQTSLSTDKWGMFVSVRENVIPKHILLSQWWFHTSLISLSPTEECLAAPGTLRVQQTRAITITKILTLIFSASLFFLSLHCRNLFCPAFALPSLTHSQLTSLLIPKSDLQSAVNETEIMVFSVLRHHAEVVLIH